MRHVIPPAGIPLWAVMLAAISVAAVAGCATAPSSRSVPPGVVLRWPPPPQAARIEWTGEIRDPRDLGIGMGFWNKLAELVSGRDVTAIVRPYGVYVDREGSIFVADPGWGVVHRFDRKNGTYTRLGGTEASPLRTPIGVTGDGAGSIYVTDSSERVIFRAGPGEAVLHPFISGTVNRPTGITCDQAAGRLYVSDTAAHQVAVFDLSGREMSRLGSRGEGPGEFNFPTDLFIDRRGRLLVTDSLNGRIQILTAEGTYLSEIGRHGDAAGAFSRAKGVAVDSGGHIYVVDSLLDAVQVFDEEGRLLLDFGNQGSRPGEFWMPSGLFIDATDTIYVADSYNNRVQVFRYYGEAKQKSEPNPLQGGTP